MFNRKRGFSLAELMVAVGFAGLLLLVVCGVFIYGLNSIKKGRIRSTALNLADKKIAEAQNLMRSLDINHKIGGNDLMSLISDMDYSTLKVNGTVVDPNSRYDLWPAGGCTIDGEGAVSVNGTGDYSYKFRLEDYDVSLKKVTVDVSWQDETGKNRKITLETLISGNH